jgi:hypothetical protein
MAQVVEHLPNKCETLSSTPRSEGQRWGTKQKMDQTRKC